MKYFVELANEKLRKGANFSTFLSSIVLDGIQGPQYKSSNLVLQVQVIKVNNNDR